VRVDSLDAAAAELTRVPAQAVLLNAPSLTDTCARVHAIALKNGTPVIVCAMPGPAQGAAEMGIQGYLVKPLSMERLLDTLDRLHLRGMTVLVVDDEDDARQLVRRMLHAAKRGYRVITAADGQEALAQAREQRPDVILLDLTMPGMDGWRFLEAHRSDPALKEIPVVVVSAHDASDEPLVSSGLVLTREGGLSARQLLACIDWAIRVLGVP
jgi:CheY-like chemotaxis protein